VQGTLVRDFLHELAAAAASEFPSASCGLAVVRDDRLESVAASDARAHRLEAVDVDGPHRYAATHRCTVHVADLSTDTRWPAFQERALAEEVRSTFTTPFEIDEAHVSVGVLTMYDPEPHVFDATERQHRLDRLAGEASRALSLATRLASSERTSWHLEEALGTRATIDHAIGIVMAQNGCNADEAFAILRAASQNRNLKLRSIARELVLRVGGPPSAPPTFR
jgi:hypothetical protein